MDNQMPIPNSEPTSSVKIPFLWSLYYLKNDLNYDEAVNDIVSRGGDTRNNAAIVGGLLGTVYKIDAPTKNCDTNSYLLLL